jgi:putative transposase
LTAACRRLVGVPSDETVRKALLATLPGCQVLQQRINAALAHRLPKALRKQPWPIAIDLWDLPYYGEWDKAVRRGAKKAGTRYSHTYATAFVVRKGYRFTLAAICVKPGDKLVEVLERLLGRVHELRIRSRFLLLDRAFYTVDVVNYLKRAHRPFVMPTVHRGRKPKDLAKAKSTYRFLAWRRSGWSEHTMTDKQGEQALVNIAVSRRCYVHRQKRHYKILIFAFWGLRPSSPLWVRETYRKRFAIETSYRQANQARIYTSTRDPLRRFLFVAIALIVRNVWAWLHLVRLATGGHVHLNVLPFVDMLNEIHRFIDLVFTWIKIAGLPTPGSERS